MYTQTVHWDHQTVMFYKTLKSWTHLGTTNMGKTQLEHFKQEDNVMKRI